MGRPSFLTSFIDRLVGQWRWVERVARGGRVEGVAPDPGMPLRGPESLSDGLSPPGWYPGRGGVPIGRQRGSCGLGCWASTAGRSVPLLRSGSGAPSALSFAQGACAYACACACVCARVREGGSASRRCTGCSVYMCAIGGAYGIAPIYA